MGILDVIDSHPLLLDTERIKEKAFGQGYGPSRSWKSQWLKLFGRNVTDEWGRKFKESIAEAEMWMADTTKTTTSAKSFRLKTNGTNDGGKYVSRDNEALSFSAQRDCQFKCTDTIHHFCFSWWCFWRTPDPMVHLRQSLCS